jgi:hypothetical protein
MPERGMRGVSGFFGFGGIRVMGVPGENEGLPRFI